MALPVALHRKIVDLLTSLPDIETPNGQRAFINSAALGSQLQRQIQFSGSSVQFIELLVPLVVQYGQLEDRRNALEAVLEATKNYVGQDGREDCDRLLQEFRALPDGDEQSSKLSENSSTHRPPSQAPPLPEHFVTRPEVTDTLKIRLLNNEPTTPGILAISAIRGLGGIGKSTLAAALTYDKEVREHFSDGILWATLGQQPEILSLISGWVQAMGDENFRLTTIEAAFSHLRTLLQDKAVLLVIDDVWEVEHARHFLVGGSQSQVLMTTRRADVADEVGADRVEMNVMSSEQALELLMKRLGKTELGEEERTEALRLSEAIGYLPLALELIAVRILRGISWRVLREKFEEEIVRIKILDGRRRTIEACFNLSIEPLREDNQEAWEAFVWLGVLPEDVQVTAPMAAVIWETNETNAAEILELLWNDALLMSGSPLLVKGREGLSYRLHDLLHDFALKLLTIKQPQGLGRTLQDAHSTLLERYKQYAQNGLWYTLPDDGYIHSHLSWHFQQAGQEDLIHDLLREKTAEGKNGWYQICESLKQTSDFLSDVNLALKLAIKQSDIGLQCRYALICTSFNSLVNNIPAPVLTALVEKNVWGPNQGLAYVCQVPDPIQRKDALLSLMNHLPDSLKEQAFQEVLHTLNAIENVDERISILVNLISLHLPISLQEQASEKALQETQTLIDIEERVSTLTNRILPNLPESLHEKTLEEAVKAARLIQNAEKKAHVLATLIPSLRGSLKGHVAQEVIQIAGTIHSTKKKMDVLISIVTFLPDSLKKPVLQEISENFTKLGEPVIMLQKLRMFASYLSESLQKEVLITIRRVDDKSNRFKMLSELTPYLSEPLLEEVLTLQRKALIEMMMGSEFARLTVLSKLIPYLSAPLLKEVLASIQTFKNLEILAKGLMELAPYLPAFLLEEALAITKKMADVRLRDKVLARLTPYLPTSLMKEASIIAWGIEKNGIWSEALVEVVYQFAKQGDILEAVSLAQTIGSVEVRAKVFAHLVPYLTEGALEKILMIVRAMRESFDRDDVMTALSFRFIELGRPEKALAIAQSVIDIVSKARILTQIASLLDKNEIGSTIPQNSSINGHIQEVSEPPLPLPAHTLKTLRENLSREGLTVVKAIKNPQGKIAFFADLIPCLSENWLQEALLLAECIPKKKERSKILIEIAVRWAKLSKPDNAFAIVEPIEDGKLLSNILERLVPYLSEPCLESVQKETRWIEKEGDRAKVLGKMACRLSELGATKEAFRKLQMITDKGVRTDVLKNLVSHFSKSLLREALIMTQQVDDSDCRTRLFIKLIPYLSEPLIRTASAFIEESSSPYKDEGLKEIAIRLADLGAYHTSEELIAVTKAATNQDRMLSEIATYLSKSGKSQEGLAVAQTITNFHQKNRTLKEIALYLAEDGKYNNALKIYRTMKEPQYRAEILTRVVSHRASRDTKDTWEHLRPVSGVSVKAEFRLQSLFCLFRKLLACYHRIVKKVFLKSSAFKNAMESIKRLHESKVKIDLLVEVTPHLPEPLLRETLKMVHSSIKTAAYRAEAMAGIVPYLSEEEREDVLWDIVSTSQRITNIGNQALVLMQLTPYLKGDLLQATKPVFLAIQDNFWKIKALTACIPYLPDSLQKKRILLEAIAAAKGIDVPVEQAKALIEILPYMSEALGAQYLQEVMKIARSSQNNGTRARILVELIPHLKEPLEEQILREAISTIATIENFREREEVLSSWIHQLMEFPFGTLSYIWQELLESSLNKSREELLTEFCILVPIIAKIGRQKSITELFHAIRDVGQWWS